MVIPLIDVDVDMVVYVHPFKKKYIEQSQRCTASLQTAHTTDEIR